MREGHRAAASSPGLGLFAAEAVDPIPQPSAAAADFDTKIDALDTKMSGRFDAMGRDLSDVRERVARIEGYLIGPGRFTTRPSRPPAVVDPPSEDPDPGRRQAG